MSNVKCQFSNGEAHDRSMVVRHGAIAQLVEQRTENPCVTGSIPVGTTKRLSGRFFEKVQLFSSGCKT